VHFSDIPHEGAQTIDIPLAPSPANAPSVPGQAPVPAPHESSADSLAKQEHVYTKINIIQPQNSETIRSSQGFLAVAVQIDPALMPGDMMQLLFDGATLGEPQVNPLFQLSGIYRGSHTIAVQIIDANGTVLETSDSITVYMQNPRVGMGRPGGR
jgi:hypothetical protein